MKSSSKLILSIFFIFLSLVQGQTGSSNLSSIQAQPCLYDNGDYFPTGEWYNLIAKHSNKCVGSISDGSIKQTTCLPYKFEQRWRIIPLKGCQFTFQEYAFQKTIDNKYQIKDNNNIQWLIDPNGSVAQIFTVEGGNTNGWRIKNVGSNKCLTILDASPNENVDLVQYDCSNSSNQLFYVRHNSIENFLIKAKHSGKCLSSQDGQVKQYDCSRKSKNHQWWLMPFRGTYVGFYNLFDDWRKLDNWNASRNKGTYYGVVPQNYNTAQDYYFEYFPDNYVRIRNSASNLCLDIYGGYVDNGTPLIQWDCHEFDNQRFRLEPIP